MKHAQRFKGKDEHNEEINGKQTAKNVKNTISRNKKYSIKSEYVTRWD